MKPNQNRKLSQAELLDAFPEAKQIIPELISESMQWRSVLAKRVTDRLAIIKHQSPNESFYDFRRSWLKATFGQDLVELDEWIAYLSRRLKALREIPNTRTRPSDELIKSAQAVPIEILVNKQSGRNEQYLVCSCPLHDDEILSFHIYRSENRAWCFSCNQNFDSITLVMLMHGCGFNEAVLTLVGYCYEN